MRKRKIGKNRPLMLLSAALLPASQVLSCSAAVSGDVLQYEGTTEMTTDPELLDMDVSKTELLVEEVYVQEGDSISAGDPILKLTDESYQEALDYYDASIIRAANSLTDTQRSYDQGVLEVNYAYEKAKTEAAAAEFVKEYQTEELTDCIADHQELITDLEERIAEIEAGNYGSSQSAGGGSSSGSMGGSSGGGFGSSSGSGGDSSDTDDDMERPDNREEQPEEQNPPEDSEQNPETPDSHGPDEGAPDTEEGETPENGEEQNPPEDSEPNADGDDDSEKKPEAPTEDEKRIQQIKEEITTTALNEQAVLEQLLAALEAVGNVNQEEGETVEATEENRDNLSAAEQEYQAALKEKLQSSIEGDALIKGHMSNLKTMVDEKLDMVVQLAGVAGIDYNSYLTLLNDCVTRMETDIAIQQEVLEALTVYSLTSGIAGEETIPEGTAADSEEKETMIRNLVDQYVQANQTLSSLYAELVTLEEKRLNSI